MTANWSGTPATWAAGGLSSTTMNAEVRDRMEWLKAALLLAGIDSDTVLGQLKSARTGVRALRLTTQSIPNTSLTAVQFTTADAWDSDSLHDPSTNSERITFGSGMGGDWDVGWAIEWNGDATGYRYARVLLNGSTAILGLSDRTAPSAATDWEHSAVTPYSFSSGDYITLQAYQSSGSSLAINQAVFWAERRATT